MHAIVKCFSVIISIKELFHQFFFVDVFPLSMIFSRDLGRFPLHFIQLFYKIFDFTAYNSLLYNELWSSIESFSFFVFFLYPIYSS
jgi:hypothetical protein